MRARVVMRETTSKNKKTARKREVLERDARSAKFLVGIWIFENDFLNRIRVIFYFGKTRFSSYSVRVAQKVVFENGIMTN